MYELLNKHIKEKDRCSLPSILSPSSPCDIMSEIHYSLDMFVAHVLHFRRILLSWDVDEVELIRKGERGIELER